MQRALSVTTRRAPQGGRFLRSLRLIALFLVLVASLALPFAVAAQEAEEEADVEEVVVDPRAFADTGFRISDDAIWGYGEQHGGVATFGSPISRTFTLQGARVQLFQKALLRVQPNGTVQPASLMGAEWMPYTRFGGSTVPAADQVLATVTPRPDQPAYETRLLEFARSYAPNTWQGQPVQFQTALTSGASAVVWGAPTSAPAADPTNPSFVYQRFERGVLMYNAQAGSTTWMPMGDALKSLLTGQNLSPDLAEDAARSPLLGQYAPTLPNGLARPDLLPNTNLTNAFTPDVEAIRL